ncbi:epidermal growth factor receptor-like [Tubulanus polymorphus]|uniref:epidermal growth factor receptor-like n=1 Tax=Tubulanus polymorphus TaxID=672921 RepID=UPI003DA3206E
MGLKYFWWILLLSVSVKIVGCMDLIHLDNVCRGTEIGLNVEGTHASRYEMYRNRYTNCTYVDGNLEIVFLDDPSTTYNLTFLENIREVTGYVLITSVYTNYISLHNLQLIRGRDLFRVVDQVGEFALYVALNVQPSSKTNGLMELRLTSLREILSGSVYFLNNNLLCHHNTINWDDIISGRDARTVIESTSHYYRRPCNKCHSSCKVNGGSYCWGDGPDMCQTLNRVICSPQCDGRCYGPGPSECCHAECAAGCSNPKRGDCVACRKFYNDGLCESYCPEPEIYDSKLYKYIPNPNAKFTYGNICTKECPKYLYQHRSACVKKCPKGEYAMSQGANKAGKCVKCDGPCPKDCPGIIGDNDFIHSNNIGQFRGCTVITNNVRILSTSFSGDPHYGYRPMEPSELNALKDVKEIHGYLMIQSDHKNLTNLSFLENLETIHGKYLDRSGSILHVSHNKYLTYLGLRSLKQLRNSAGVIFISNNPQLCFAVDYDWSKLNPNAKSYFAKNSGRAKCLTKGLKCDPGCAGGCMGPGPEQCQDCVNFRVGSRCVSSCYSEPGLYDAGNQTCKKCHKECNSNCKGPDSDHCSDGCKNFKDGPFCVEKCPSSKYPDDTKHCKPCHDYCVGGCTGPLNKVGKNACNNCSFVVMKNATEVDHCLESNPDKYVCPDGYYLKYTLNQHSDKNSFSSLLRLASCIRCDDMCRTCTSAGDYNCPRCKYYRFQSRCISRCPEGTYAEPDEVGDLICRNCHDECKRGCTGKSTTDCKLCLHFRVDIDDPGKDRKINCTAKCPKTHPYTDADKETGEDVCLVTMPASMSVVIGSVTGAVFLIIIGIGVIAYYCRLRALSKENALKLTARLSGYTDDVPLTPSDAKPDMAHMRLVKESELRRGGIIGSGAFGTVYKGVWIPEGENVKIPVAIKVLQEGNSPCMNKELLEEARVMASVDHPCCIRVLCVCMTAQMMLVTQLMPLGCLLDYVRKHQKNIGSKALLNWCTQIARGMQYLEERGIVHRDLAARNVLVQSSQQVKITDFGLAKLLDYHEEEYHATGGKMPIKWLALECIQHRIFTKKSDVWSFGVTVWELFTYGQRPYEGIRARDVPDLLEKGERLPQPLICTIDVYMIMIKCWMLDAESRPSFKELGDEFEKMARDPGRYLVIRGDKLLRLPSHTYDTNDLVRSMSVSGDGPETVMDAEDYLSPKMLLSGEDESPDVDIKDGIPHAMMQANGRFRQPAYDERSTPNCSPAKESDNLIAPKRDKKYGHLEASRPVRGTSVASRYSSDPCKVLKDDMSPKDKCDGLFDGIDSTDFHLDLPVDEDDYLQPRSMKPNHYMDVIDNDTYVNPSKPPNTLDLDIDKNSNPRSMDNPGYFIMGRGPSTSPSCSPVSPTSFGSSSPTDTQPLHQKSPSSEEHDYYNVLNSSKNKNNRTIPYLNSPNETTV